MTGSGRPPVGRFAPSPTGDLHLGSALALVGAWASARSRGGRFVWRVEDLDGPRAVAGAAERQIEDARWLGVDWDEGPDPDAPDRDLGARGPYRQSRRGDAYEAALARLADAGRLFPCRRSRKDLQALATAPHGASGLPPYPARWRPAPLGDGWLDALGERPDCALRFRVDDPPVTFDDRVVGRVTEDVRETVGDVVLRRRDGAYAYQLAVVVDDLAHGVTEVVRGQDLLDSTARQILLIRALGGTPPAYAHLPLLVNEAGEKLSKRDAVPTVRGLRERGVEPEAVVGWLAHALGQSESRAPMAAAELARRWDWARVRTGPVVARDVSV